MYLLGKYSSVVSTNTAINYLLSDAAEDRLLETHSANSTFITCIVIQRCKLSKISSELHQ